MGKKKVLWATEAHYLNTGFANYAREIISRLHKTDKYEIAEMAGYGRISEARSKNIPWKFYCNSPEPNQKEENAKYNSNPLNQFGMFRWERVLLDFRPDICSIFRDAQHDSHIFRSSLRPYYHLIAMSTLDSHPYKVEYLYDYASADKVLTYSQYGYDVLSEQGKNKINLVGQAGGGIDPTVFKPVADKRLHRQQMGIRNDVNIVGTVMRNQPRKLFPDLFAGFRQFLNEAIEKGSPLANNTFLYIHTGYPDVAWEIPELINRYQLSSKLLCSYFCKICKQCFASFFQDARTICPRCNNVSAILPNVVSGTNQEQLANVYNLFDVYVQYASCEGFGLPIVEAAACDVLPLVVNHTAMSDFPNTIGAWPIEVQRLFTDVDQHTLRAMPSNKSLVEQLFNFFALPLTIRQNKAFQCRNKAISLYSWDKLASKWEYILDHCQLIDKQGKWDSPPDLKQPAAQIPDNLSNPDFVRWCIVNILGQAEKTNTHFEASVLRHLNYGADTSELRDMKKFTREHLVKKLLAMVKNHNDCELVRCGLAQTDNPDYIQFANLEKTQ